MCVPRVRLSIVQVAKKIEKNRGRLSEAYRNQSAYAASQLSGMGSQILDSIFICSQSSLHGPEELD